MNKVITISRQYGSGGRTIGKKLAEKLNIPFYDNEIIALAAKTNDMDEKFFENAEMYGTSSFLYTAYMTGHFELPLNDKVFLYQSRAIREVAQKGPCIIVGRCANYVLRDFENVINVFIHADLKTRIKRVVEEYGEPADKAKDIILRTDKKRAAYFNYYTSVKFGQVENYHLSLDAGYTGVDAAVELIANIYNIEN